MKGGKIKKTTRERERERERKRESQSVPPRSQEVIPAEPKTVPEAAGWAAQGARLAPSQQWLGWGLVAECQCAGGTVVCRSVLTKMTR